MSDWFNDMDYTIILKDNPVSFIWFILFYLKTVKQGTQVTFIISQSLITCRKDRDRKGAQLRGCRKKKRRKESTERLEAETKEGWKRVLGKRVQRFSQRLSVERNQYCIAGERIEGAGVLIWLSGTCPWISNDWAERTKLLKAHVHFSHKREPPEALQV